MWGGVIYFLAPNGSARESAAGQRARGDLENRILSTQNKREMVVLYKPTCCSDGHMGVEEERLPSFLRTYFLYESAPARKGRIRMDF